MTKHHHHLNIIVNHDKCERSFSLSWCGKKKRERKRRQTITTTSLMY